jgi:N utilization substance protein B
MNSRKKEPELEALGFPERWGDGSSVGNRSQARVFALQLLYQWDLRACPISELLDTFWVDVFPESSIRSFAEQILHGVVKEKDAIDAMIDKYSLNWRIKRMPLVDRNILRLGVFELCYMPEIPVSVTLNEAIELGKCYSTREAGAFVNGLLDKIAHDVVTVDASGDDRDGGAQEGVSVSKVED